ncbi:MAG: hypothetical protein HPY89_06050 [Pelotomaculum sp.]|nr:hypothetical protein [Pelotomaculum sp.]
MVNRDLYRKCQDCGQKIYLGEAFYQYEDDEGLVREVCEKCLINFLENLRTENDKKPIA